MIKGIFSPRSIAFTLGFVCMLSSLASAATYHVEFEGTWSAATHPNAFPANNAHFTNLIGATHNDSVSFWAEGELATLGIERVAELGSTSSLRTEVQAAIDAGSAASIVSGGSLFGLPSSTSLDIDVNESHALVTLASMVAPSPDWFVGVSGVSLRDQHNWLGQVQLELDAYDAGTEDGTTFSLSNPASSPHQPIHKITSGLLADVPPLATLTFTVQPNGLVGDFNLDGQVDTDDRNVWVAGFGTVTDSSVSSVSGDANGDGHVNGRDYLLWQANLGNSLSEPIVSATIPEPNTLLLLATAAAVFLTRTLAHRHA